MSTDLSSQIDSTSSEQTAQIAASIGAKLVGGEIFVLKSDLGGGKTTFTKGLVRGAGSEDMVASPTFTISKVYDAPKFTVHHFDFYRLNEPGIIAAELDELIGDPKIVTIVEWPEIVTDILPKNVVNLDIKNMGDDSRQLLFTYPSQYTYLFEELL